MLACAPYFTSLISLNAPDNLCVRLSHCLYITYDEMKFAEVKGLNRGHTVSTE